jgi:hypothetical protein
MRYADAVPAALVLVLRAAWLAVSADPGAGPLPPVLRWLVDWISVLALLAVALVLSGERSRRRTWSLAVACAWLALLYGAHQGGHTWAGWK